MSTDWLDAGLLTNFLFVKSTAFAQPRCEPKAPQALRVGAVVTRRLTRCSQGACPMRGFSYLSPPSLPSFPGTQPADVASLECPSFAAGDSWKEKAELGV